MKKVLKLKELELEGFRSFRQKAIIKFPESGVMLLSGKWKDSSTSSGSGKSSVFLGIAFVLGYCDRPASSLKNWHSKKMRVRLQVSDGMNIYDIIRDPKLSILKNGVSFSETSADAEEKLIKLIKTTPELAQALTYRPQRKLGTFLNKTDADKKEFLANVLSLSTFEKMHSDISDQIKSDLIWIEQANKNLINFNNFINSNEIKDDEFEKAKIAYETAHNRYELLTQQQNNSELDNNLIAAQEQYKNIQVAKKNTENSKQKIYSLKQEFICIRDEVAKLKQNICYTCNREWFNAENIVLQKEQKAKEIFFKVKECESIIQNSFPLVETESKILQIIQNLSQQIGALKSPLEDSLVAKKISADNLRRINETKNSVEKAKNQYLKMKSQVDEVNDKIKINQHILNITGKTGFMANIFDEVLSAIENRANEFIGQLPNVSTYSLQISSSSATQKGTIKKSINAKLIKENEEIDIKDVSGGQQCSIELSTDLAVAEEIRARSGSPLGWIALDEAMDGLDIESKKTALDCIKMHNKGLIIIIDHSTEIKENFDAVVQIEFDGKESYVCN